MSSTTVADLTTPVPSITEQAAAYDVRWAAHHYANNLKMRRATAILAEINRLHLKEPRIVDLGCGTGWMTAILGQFGPATGLELSPLAVETARSTYPCLRFEVADLSSYEPTEQYDIVVSQEVLEHTEDQVGHMRLAYDLLAPGGHLVLTTPNADTFDALDESSRARWSNQPLELWVDPRTTRRLAEEAGLEVERLTTVIPNFGRRGRYLFVNSIHLRHLMDRMGWRAAFDRSREIAGFGLHTLMVARRPQ